MRACDSVCQNRCRMQEYVLLETVAIQDTYMLFTEREDTVPEVFAQKTDDYG